MNLVFLQWRVKKQRKSEFLRSFLGESTLPICLQFYQTFRHFELPPVLPSKTVSDDWFCMSLFMVLSPVSRGTVPKNEWTNRTTSDNLFCKCACSDLSPTLLCSTFDHIYGTNRETPRLDTVFYNTEMNIWAGQNFLAAHIVLPKGQNILFWWINYDLNPICFSNFIFQFVTYVNFS